MIPLNAPYDFYGGLPPEVRAAIDARSRYHDLPKGSQVTRQGQPCDHLHQILDGEVKVSSTSRDGRETVFALIRSGGWVAVSEIFSGLPIIADVTALCPIRVRSLARESLLDLMRVHPQIAEQLLRVLSQRFSLLYHFSVDRSVLTLKERVIKTLYMQAVSRGLHGPEAVIPLPQEELGKLLDVGRQALNRVLKELEAEGIARIAYGGVRLRDPAALLERYRDLLDVAQPVAVDRDRAAPRPCAPPANA